MTLAWRRGRPPATSRGPLRSTATAASSPGTKQTKAEILQWLRPRGRTFDVPPLTFFSVSQWRHHPQATLCRIHAAVDAPRMAVRSSARDERAHPGRYRSCLDVPTDDETLGAAIESVIASFDDNPHDQVLVQAMVGPVVASGVVVTTDLDRGGPYVSIEYDVSGRTDRVTGGTGLHRRVLVHRKSGPPHVRDPRVQRLLRVVSELQRLWPSHVLELEFAETTEAIHVLQVRLVSPMRRWTCSDTRMLDRTLSTVAEHVAHASNPRDGIVGTRTILGTMPDWNPAELIGVLPTPLAASILAYLVTDRVWADARTRLGYRPVRCPLVQLLGGRPYVDVRLSFNSLLPSSLPADLAEPIVDAWVAKLHASPELHDKVEFEVAQTAWDLDAEATLRRRYATALSRRALATLATQLRALTARLVTNRLGGSLARALARIERAGARYTPVMATTAGIAPSVPSALRLLADCRRYDALPFAIVARHAFIAEAMLRSAVTRGALDLARVTAFKQQLSTVTQTFRKQLLMVQRGTVGIDTLLREFGHLRPGSFDVTSPRYDSWIDGTLCGMAPLADAGRSSRGFSLFPAERRALDQLLGEAGLPVDARGLLRYAAAAIVGRERAKFLMTRRLSDALEILASFGVGAGIAREALAHLTLQNLAECAQVAPAEQSATLRRHAASARTRRAAFASIRLADLLKNPADVWVVESAAAQPTFVTTRSVVAPVVSPAPHAAGEGKLAGRVVCIESADPGYEWIFTQPLGGLVTCFGGPNSHMGIRCTELGVPAALGVGEPLFERVSRATRVELRCGEQILRPVCDTA